MKHLMLSAAVLCLAASGCARLACRDCGQGGHVTRSQQAPRPIIARTMVQDDSTSLLGRHKKCSLLGGGLLGRSHGSAHSCTDCDGSDYGSCDDDAGYYDCGAGSCDHGEGCHDPQCDANARGGPSLCGSCGGQGCRECRLGKALCPHSGGYPERPIFNPGPPVGQVAYPYYTVRGPRDFLQDNPPSIGPY